MNFSAMAAAYPDFTPMNPTLKESNPTPGHVYKIESAKFGVDTVVCIEVPAAPRSYPLQFVPLGKDGIARETLYFASVCDDQVLETFPTLRAYLAAIDGPQVEEPPADARGSKPVAAADGAAPTPPPPAAPPSVPVTVPPPPRPLPAGCCCDPTNWPPLPFKIPSPCKSYTEDLTEAGKCVMCEHLQECH